MFYHTYENEMGNINYSTIRAILVSQMHYIESSIFGRVVKGYRQVSVPDAFYEEVEKFLQKHPELGYTSLAEFVRVAVREKMEEWKKEHVVG